MSGCKGPRWIEYGLIASLIAVAIVGALLLLGPKADQLINRAQASPAHNCGIPDIPPLDVTD